MAGTLSLATAPAVEPVSLEVAKKHLKFSHNSEDELVTAWIAAARELAESFTGRQLVGATWDLSLDTFPCGQLMLPRAPLLSVTSVKYLDTTGTEQTLASTVYRSKAFAGPQCRPGHLSLAYAQTWPAHQVVADAVTIRFVAGYSAQAATAAVAQAAVPMAIRQAMLLLLAEFDRRRSTALQGTIITEVPLSARNLLAPFRVHVS